MRAVSPTWQVHGTLTATGQEALKAQNQDPLTPPRPYSPAWLTSVLTMPVNLKGGGA